MNGDYEKFHLEVFHPGCRWPVRIVEKADLFGGKIVSDGYRVYRLRGRHAVEYWRVSLESAYALACKPMERSTA